MKTKKDGIRNAFEPYMQEEVELILSTLPTHQNVYLLSKALGRSDRAIRVVYRVAYTPGFLKVLLDKNPNGQAIGNKVLKAKKKLGLFLGHDRDEAIDVEAV